MVFGLEVGRRFDSQALARVAAGPALTQRWTALAELAALRAHVQSWLELPVRPGDASDGVEPPL